MKKSTLLGLGMLLATTGIAALSSVDVSAHGLCFTTYQPWLSRCSR